MYIVYLIIFYDLGVIAFVDYKINGECCSKGIKKQLTKLGAQVEKKINQRVIT